VGFDLSRDRKTATEGAEVTRSGRLFQTRAAATGKARSCTDGRQSGAADNQLRSGTKSPTILDICPLTKLIGNVCRCRPVKTLVHEDCMHWMQSALAGAFSQCSWRYRKRNTSRYRLAMHMFTAALVCDFVCCCCSSQVHLWGHSRPRPLPLSKWFSVKDLEACAVCTVCGRCGTLPTIRSTFLFST